MRSTFKILFYIKKNAIRKSGMAPIMARVTVNGKATQFSLKCEVNPKDWDPKACRAIGKTAQVYELNALLDNLRASIRQHYREISDKESYVTAEKVKNSFLGLQVSNKTLLELFSKHLEDLNALCGKEISRTQIQRYELTIKRLGNFMKQKYGISDIALKEINQMFLHDFEIYLKSVCNCGHNTAVKFLQRIKTIMRIAKDNGWVHVDPFANFKLHLDRVDRGYLTDQELEAIMEKSFPVKRLEEIRDIFIFSSFTGLAYIDVKNLKKENIQKSFDGKLWIMGKRTKTGVIYNIPLLEIPQMILNKYNGKLPILSNQKTNAYLKEIGDLCGIKKNLTFHLARHSFATLSLSKGVSIESVSKMLGHTNIKTTQVYARITDLKISNDMNILASKLKEMESKFAINQ